MNDDSIIDELYRAREAYAQRFNFDVVAMAEHIRESSRTFGGERVTLAPGPLEQRAVAQENADEYGNL